MNYLWEAMLYLKEEGIEYDQIRFQVAKVYSAYLEVSNIYLNQISLEDKGILEINPFYRFWEIFKDLYAPESADGVDIKDSITNVILHGLAENDCKSGMTKESYYKKLLYQDFKAGRYGEHIRTGLELFCDMEKELILSALLCQYETGHSLDLFKHVLASFIDDTIVYSNRSNPDELIIYIGSKREDLLEKRIDFFIAIFLDIRYQVSLYFEHHFGIIGIDETMIVDRIAMC